MQLKWPMLWDLFSLFPAHAGVIPVSVDRDRISLTFPRTRGGDPSVQQAQRFTRSFSPHTRG